jgi:glycosyltransferase involved in cell wall biosynthesis
MSFWSEVSVVMIALDAEDLLPGALKSIPEEAEVIVADGGSRDRAVAIARAHGADVIDQDRAAIAAADGNFDVARNDAARRASRDWIFFLDADERITEALAAEIARLVDDGLSAAFDMPRINHFWGRPVRLLGEDRQIRLVHKGHGRFEGTALHRGMTVDGSVESLHGPLVHLNVRNWADVRLRFRRYLPSEARHHEPVSSRIRAIRLGSYMFRYYYLTQGAWRDGWRGLVVCLVYAVYHGAAAWQSRRYVHS